MSEIFLLMPEILLVLTLAFVVVGEITYYGERIRLVTVISLFGLAAAFLQTVISYQYGATQVFGGALTIDGFALFFKMLFIVLAGLSIASVSQSKEIQANKRTEYCALILAASLAMCLVAAASDLIFILLSILFLNLVSYFLAAYGRKSMKSTEAAIKYMVFGAISIVLFQYALAILFTGTHSLNIYEIHRALVTHPLSTRALLIAFMLSFLALNVQIGAFPMYLTVPDVLEGSPTPVSAFLSFGTRAAGFAVCIRFLIVVFAQPGASPGQWQVMGEFDWTKIVSIISALTMAAGALLAFRQQAAKRMVGYLVVYETGFFLLGLLVLDEVGIAAILYNLVIDLFALVGSFFVLSYIYDELGSDRLIDLKGMLKKAVPECICLVLFLLCLTGSPPMPGFIGKFTLLGIAIRHHRPVLALIGILSMVTTTAAVIRLTYHLMDGFRETLSVSPTPSYSRKVFLLVLMVPMGLAGVFAELIFHWVDRSIGFIFW